MTIISCSGGQPHTTPANFHPSRSFHSFPFLIHQSLTVSALILSLPSINWHIFLFSLTMSSTSLFRLASRAAVRPCGFVKAPLLPRSRLQPAVWSAATRRANNFSTTCQRFSGAHEDETFEEFSARYAYPSNEPCRPVYTREWVCSAAITGEKKKKKKKRFN